jgi:hypothetical protein
MASDESWAEVAHESRAALASLGYSIGPRCLPDEADPCGASFAQHAAAHLATIKAVCDHQLSHLGSPYIERSGIIYGNRLTELESDCNCQGTRRH